MQRETEIVTFLKLIDMNKIGEIINCTTGFTIQIGFRRKFPTFYMSGGISSFNPIFREISQFILGGEGMGYNQSSYFF